MKSELIGSSSKWTFFRLNAFYKGSWESLRGRTEGSIGNSCVLWAIKEHSSIRNLLSKGSSRRRYILFRFPRVHFNFISINFPFFFCDLSIRSQERKEKGRRARTSRIRIIRSATFGQRSRKRKVFPSFGENCVRMVNGRDDGRSPSANLHKNASTVWRIKRKNSSVRRVSPTKRWYLSSD